MANQPSTKPKFFDGEIVKTSPKHYSQKRFTMLRSPTWTENRGWVYEEIFVEFIPETGKFSGSGSSFWNDEFLYEPITLPTEKMLVEKFYRLDKILKLEKQIQDLKDEVVSIDFSIRLCEKSSD